MKNNLSSSTFLCGGVVLAVLNLRTKNLPVMPLSQEMFNFLSTFKENRCVCP